MKDLKQKISDKSTDNTWQRNEQKQKKKKLLAYVS